MNIPLPTVLRLACEASSTPVDFRRFIAFLLAERAREMKPGTFESFDVEGFLEEARLMVAALPASAAAKPGAEHAGLLRAQPGRSMVYAHAGAPAPAGWPDDADGG